MACINLGDGNFFVTTDARGRTSFAGVAEKNTRYLAEEHPDGTIVLTPVKIVPSVEVYT